MAEPDPRRVFIVHGRNGRAVGAVSEILRAVGLMPLEWEQARAATGKPTPTIWEIVEAGFAACRSALVILSGDDEVRLRPELVRPEDHPDDTEFRVQSRPNVFIEMGAALAGGQDAVVIAQLGPHRPVSDIQGFHFHHLKNSAPSRKELVERLRSAGAEPDMSGSAFLGAGDLDGAVLPYPTTAMATPPIGAPAGALLAVGPPGEIDDPCPPGSPEEEVVKFLFEAAGLVRLVIIAGRLSMEFARAQYHLERLEESGLVEPRRSRYSSSIDVAYRLTRRGRALVVERGLR